MDNNFAVISATVSDRGLSEKRPENEDSFIAIDDSGLYAVADGVGGAQAGDVASQMAVEILGEAFTHYGDSVDPEDIMQVALERANEAIYRMSTELPQLSTMATTIASIHISGNIATIAHVGDSRVYRVDPDGVLHRETNDHSLVEEEVRAGRMTPEQAANHPSKNVISRALGAEATVAVELKTIMVDPGTSFLLCSDGITRHIEDPEIEHLMTTGMAPEMLVMQMKEICYDRGAEDNLTAVVVKILPTVAEHRADHAEAAPIASPPVFPAAQDPGEEETIATARSPFDEPVTEEATTADLAEPQSDGLDDLRREIAEEEAAAPANDDEFLGALDDQGRTIETENSEYSSSGFVVPAEPTRPEPARDEFKMFGANGDAEVETPRSGPGIVSRILSTLVWLVLGAIIGIGGYYYWNINNPIVQQAPPPLVQPSSDVQVSSLEEARRLVDADPKGYLEKNSATPQDAADHYLLGRALLLDGKYFEAQRQFRMAKDKLGEADEKDRATIAAEVALASAIISSGPATEALKKELDESRPASSNTNANAANTANANAAPANANAQP
ncbi:MAG: serine/threonine-protein phosphatase [Acidobacteria bacterium]|nr:serine/threonine-protein phosphatase [Acidobacteriota bacterium]